MQIRMFTTVALATIVALLSTGATRAELTREDVVKVVETLSSVEVLGVLTKDPEVIVYRKIGFEYEGEQRSVTLAYAVGEGLSIVYLDNNGKYGLEICSIQDKDLNGVVGKHYDFSARISSLPGICRNRYKNSENIQKFYDAVIHHALMDVVE
jgi:hypothetical protein